MIGNASARLRRAFVALTMTTAAVATVVGVAEPAHAVTSCSTSTVIDEGGKTYNHVMTWGDFEAVHVNVTAHCSDSSTPSVSVGTATLYRSVNGGATWSAIRTGSGYSADYLSFYGSNVIGRNTIFKAVYTGGSDTTYGRNYAASQDAPGTTGNGLIIAMIRKTTRGSYTCGTRGCHVSFKISPAASIRGLYVHIQKRRSGSWHAWGRVKVGYKGNFTYMFPPGYYRLIVPKGRGFIASRYGTLHIYKY